ncbi:MAG TPA: hypothetical protein VNK46_12685 [Nitrospiraceae bacterium]|nr:hypothetical protein [Nitrospiraceae bacterium]
MNLRAVLIFLVLGFIGLLLAMGAVSFVRWLKLSYPRHFRPILTALGLAAVGLGLWSYEEAAKPPAFHPGDLITLEAPVVARLIPAGRTAPQTSCMVEIYEHLAVMEVESGTLKARVESNTQSGPSFCPIRADVQLDPAWLHRYTLTHRHS